MGGLTYTNLVVQFARYDSPLFEIWRAWDAPQTANYALAPSPEDAVPDPDYPGFVLNNGAILITKGRWNYTAEDGFSSNFSQGDGAFRYRKPCAYRVMALDDLNGKMCVVPKDGTFWQRDAVAVPVNGTIVLGPYAEDRYLFVGRGLLRLESGEEVVNTVPLKITAGEAVLVTAEAAALGLLMWK